jgi:hypothetical protein
VILKHGYPSRMPYIPLTINFCDECVMGKTCHDSIPQVGIHQAIFKKGCYILICVEHLQTPHLVVIDIFSFS